MFLLGIFQFDKLPVKVVRMTSLLLLHVAQNTPDFASQVVWDAADKRLLDSGTVNHLKRIKVVNSAVHAD